MSVVLIHRSPQFMDECCDLINAEWPRSKTARMRSMQGSCDALPTSLALIENDHVIGYSKVSAIYGMARSCFVESVIIHPNFRGKGLGRLLMCETEKFAASVGMDTVYLSTTDQQEFYKRLGYTECPPVSLFSYIKPNENPSSTYKVSSLPVLSTLPSKDVRLPALDEVPPPPPPPPPPPVPTTPLSSKLSCLKLEPYSVKSYFRKNILIKSNNNWQGE